MSDDDKVPGWEGQIVAWVEEDTGWINTTGMSNTPCYSAEIFLARIGLTAHMPSCLNGR